MRFACLAVAVIAIVVVRSPLVAADDDPPTKWLKWVKFEDKKLGIELRHPAAAKLAVHGTVITISGPGVAPMTISIETTTERGTNTTGGQHELHVDWTIGVPKRVAHCVAEAADLDTAAAASMICESIELAPGPRDPHLELTVTSSGLADGAAYEKALRAKSKPLDACWIAALRKDAALPEGAITLARTYTDGQPAGTDESHQNFFDHDTKALAACISGILKGVAVKTSAPSAQIKIVAVCRLY